MRRRTYLLLYMSMGAVAGLLGLALIPGQHNWLDAKLAMAFGVAIGYGLGRVIHRHAKE